MIAYQDHNNCRLFCWKKDITVLITLFLQVTVPNEWATLSTVCSLVTRSHSRGDLSSWWSSQHTWPRQCTGRGSCRIWRDRHITLHWQYWAPTHPLPLLMMPTRVYLFLWEHIRGPPESSWKDGRFIICVVWRDHKCHYCHIHNKRILLPARKKVWWANKYVYSWTVRRLYRSLLCVLCMENMEKLQLQRKMFQP